jgi:integration host factor subunit beta
MIDAGELAGFDEEVWRVERLAEIAQTPAKTPKPVPSSNGKPEEAAPFTIQASRFPRAHLVLELSSKLQVPETEAEEIVESVFHAIEGAVAGGKRVEIRGFGSFSARARKAWKGRNPKNKKRYEVGPRRTPHFKSSQRLKDLVNKGPGDSI